VRRPPALLIAAILLAGCDSGADSGPEPAPRPSPAITRAELTDHLAALQRIADENGGNRAAGTRGYDASVAYVAARLRDAGWRVRLQRVGFPHFELRRASVSVGGRRLRRGRDFQVLTYSGSGSVSSRIRRLGNGCAAEEFEALPADEIPVVSRGICFFRMKAANAARAGAPALIVVDDARDGRGVPGGTLATQEIRIPVVLVADRALAATRGGESVDIAVSATSGRRTSRNVIADTPGGRGRVVVMAGAHLDSVPAGPGINDNGSGVAALIEAAEAIGPRPDGTPVRLAFWAAEEVGLVGSRHYVRSLSLGERLGIGAYLNLDVVGSPNPVAELYVDGDRRLGRLLRRTAGRPLGSVAAGAASDHVPFQAAGIPVNGLYTGSTERGPNGRPRDPCYHLACDTLRNVNRGVLLRMARATARALRRLSARLR
jgi:Zn-dependent M28 family amino/carboxypeptidase